MAVTCLQMMLEQSRKMPEETILSQQTSVNPVPFIGQRFVSQDAAYEFYCSFVKQCGFSIRCHCTHGKGAVGRGVTERDFTCHRGGYPQLNDRRSKMERIFTGREDSVTFVVVVFGHDAKECPMREVMI